MKCSDKEWQHCQKEKRGCEGCAYNDEIAVGDYVRTNKGKIAQIKEIRLGKHKSLDEFINMYIFDNENWTADKYIVKHSKNIIDLIEEGDYVNGMELYEFDDDEGNLYLGFPVYDDALMNCIEEVRPLNTVQIKSIITKEQIKQIEFRIKE